MKEQYGCKYCIDAALAEPVGDWHETWDSAKTAALNDLQDVRNALLEVNAPDANSPADQIRKLYEMMRSDVVGLAARYYEARAEVEWLRKGLVPIADGTIWNAVESARFLLERNK